MHLLNVTTLKLETFLVENERPPYAILSHTWLPNHEEVSYQDLETYHEALVHKQTARAYSISSRKGFEKIQGCCNIASQCYNLNWAWVDTCCINKESSAELSEAINSMFKWYKTAAICIAFLQDVQGVQQDAQQNVQSPDNLEDPDNDRAHFRKSKWFTRGWTLQELLAPQQHLLFYDSQWQFIGDMKEDAQLCDIVSDITSIPVAFLTGAPLSEACVAKKMSWASERKTTRVEDIAYSLLGIFGVSMPLLYGEGNRAFIRLQEEIINQTHDHSILAWGNLLSNHEDPLDYRGNLDYWKDIGALAASPADFKDCWDYERASEFLRYNNNLDFQITTAGIRLGANFFHGSSQFYLCTLSCFSWRQPEYCLGIIIQEGPLAEPRTLKLSTHLSQYVRAARIVTTELHASALTEAYPFGSWQRVFLLGKLHRGRSITLAKSVAHSTVRSIERHNQDAGVVLLDLPKGFGLEPSYISPDFDFEVRSDKRGLGKSSFRIVYSNNSNITFPYIPTAVYLAMLISAFMIIVNGLTIVVRLSAGPLMIPIVVLISVATIVHLVTKLWYFRIRIPIWKLYKLLREGIGRSTNYNKVNRDDVRVCLRITEPSQRTLASDAKAIMLIICFWPRWTRTLEDKRKHISILRKATLECYLSPVLTEGDVELNHPTGLDLRPTVYREWHSSRGDKFYIKNVQEFSCTTRESRNPSLTLRFCASIAFESPYTKI
ncbi:heterokaryon incompatibility protein-domain-containing protein [Xylaria castorea]|nr:heterokaryon incompatibility protein-domain-containing protein [Xylaria castorea]